MTLPYSGNPTYPASTNLPADGDPPSGAIFQEALTDTLDRTAYFKQLTDASLDYNILGGIAGLRGISTLIAAATGGARVFIHYHSVSGDGGGGTFYAAVGAAPGTYVDDGGTIIVPDSPSDGSAAWLRVVDGRLTPEMFGCTGSHASELARMQACWDAASSRGVGVSVTQEHTLNGELNHPSRLHVNMTDAAALLQVRIVAAGSAGAALALTNPAVAGALALDLDGSTIDDGDYLRVASCINCNSTDAGAKQLGDREADYSAFAEFVQVDETAPTSVTLRGSILWDYSNTPGADSHGSWTGSVARVVSFHEGGRIEGGRITGRYSTSVEIVHLSWCRDFQISNVVVDVDGDVTQCVAMEYCLDCHVDGGRMVGAMNPGSSAGIPFAMQSCQSCSGRGGLAIEAGYQGLDVTYSVGDTTYRGGPSIKCGGNQVHARYQSVDGFTTHPGCYDSTFVDCHASHNTRGFRLRSRGDKAVACTASGPETGGGFGFYLDDCAIDAQLVACRAQGFSYGFATTFDNADYATLRALLDTGPTLLGCHSRGAFAHGFIALTAFTTAARIGPRFVDCTADGPGTDGFRIQSYNSGAVIKGCWATNIGDGNSGFRFEADSARLHIADNHAYNVHSGGFALRGPTTMITDATTFPGGESDALIYLGELHTDAATPTTGMPAGSAIVQSVKPFAQPLSVGSSSGLTIAAGAITATGSYHTVANESGAGNDDLDTINGMAEGSFLLLRQSSSSQDINITHGVGNIVTFNNVANQLNTSSSIALFFKNPSNVVLLAVYPADFITYQCKTAGGAALPGYAFAGDTDTGVFRVSSNVFGIATGGAQRLQVSSTALQLSAAVQLDLDTTITAGGTTGAQTINKQAGSVNFAAGNATLVVTNSMVSTSSVILVTVATNDATMLSAHAVAGSGSFTIYADPAPPTAETRVNFLIMN